MPYHSPFPSFPLHVQNASAPVANQMPPAASHPARQNDPSRAIPLVVPGISRSVPMSLNPYGMMADGGRGGGAHPDTLAAVSMGQGLSRMAPSGETMMRSMGSYPPASIYASMMGSPTGSMHHQPYHPSHHHHRTQRSTYSNYPHSPPSFPSSRSPIQPSMIMLPNRTIHQTYGTVVPQNVTAQVYNDLPQDERTMRAEQSMVYNATVPHREAPGVLKDLTEFGGQNATNGGYAYGERQYGPVSDLA